MDRSCVNNEGSRRAWQRTVSKRCSNILLDTVRKAMNFSWAVDAYWTLSSYTKIQSRIPFWEVTLCRLLSAFERFKGMCLLHMHGPCTLYTLPFEKSRTPSKPSIHYMYHQFNIHKSYFLPTQSVYVFCVDLRAKRINPFMFITETENVYCAVRTALFICILN
jgi:hypothetical protein